MGTKRENISHIIENRKSRFDYEFISELECGISLWGNEVKSIENGMCNLKDSWVAIQCGQLVLRGLYIAKWETSNLFDVDERRERVLLAHKSEIRKLEQKVKQDGFTLIPKRIYKRNGKYKVLVGLAKGKHSYDKRESIKARDIQREVERSLF